MPSDYSFVSAGKIGPEQVLAPLRALFSIVDVPQVDRAVHLLLLWCWIGGIVAYSFKLAVPALDRFATYAGKLRDSRDRPKGFIASRTGWISFYSVGLLINTFLLTAFSLYSVIASDEAMRARHFQQLMWIAIRTSFTSLPLSLILLQLQLMRRLLECIFVHRFSPQRIRFVLWVAGMGFYVVLTSSFALHESRVVNESIWSASWIALLCRVLALLFFVFGSYIQHSVHTMLASFRSQPAQQQSQQQQQQQQRQYGLPRGGWFERLSVWSPHYFAEMLIYIAFLLSTEGRSVHLWLAFVLVILNLSDSALRTQRWYLEKFKDNCPPNLRQRKAIIPRIL